METTVREGYVKKGKVLFKSMKKRYLVLRSAGEMNKTAQLEFYDDQKQTKKKPTSVIPLTSVTCVKRIETTSKVSASSKEGGYFIRVDIKLDRDTVEELYLGVETRDQFEDWLSDLEFLARLPDLVIPLSIHPKRELPLTKQTLVNRNIFGNMDFEDACPVEVLQTELGFKWQFNNRYFFLILTRSSLVFLDPDTGTQILTYSIQNLRRCGHWQKLVFIESGRRTDTGSGYLWMFVHSKVLAKNFYSTLSNVMSSTLPLLVTQRYLCWDKFREELPPGSVDLLSDTGNLMQGPIADNENYFAPDVFDHTPVNTGFAQPTGYPNFPPPLPKTPIPMSQTPPGMQHFSTLSRREETELPPLPNGMENRRASLPSNGRVAADTPEVTFNKTKGGLPKKKSQTVSGNDAERIKMRYDILLIDDTQELKVGENGDVVTKLSHAITDGKGNVVKHQSTPPSHSYYDVNEMISKLSVTKKSSPSLGRKIAKLNTISTKKLTNSSAKEKIGNSTFYKGSLPMNAPDIAPYAKFSDLESQIPADVRKERLRLLETKGSRSMENSSQIGTPLQSHSPVMPQTPILYSSPKNFPVDTVYNLVDPKPRPVPSSEFLPEDISQEESNIYKVPINSDYQCPSNNSGVQFPVPTTAELDRENPIIMMESDGDYDRLAAAARDSLEILGGVASCRTPSPCYEQMISANKDESNGKAEDGDVTFLFQTSTTRSKQPLDTLVESQVFESSPLQDTSPCLQPKHNQDASSQVYEVMVDMSRKSSNPPPPPNTRYFNLMSPPQQADLLATTPRVLKKQESTPQVTMNQKPQLNKGAKSFSFRTQPSESESIYYADLELKNSKRDATVIINTRNSTDPPTHYDLIDHKVSMILNHTVQQHREKQY